MPSAITALAPRLNPEMFAAKANVPVLEVPKFPPPPPPDPTQQALGGFRNRCGKSPMSIAAPCRATFRPRRRRVATTAAGVAPCRTRCRSRSRSRRNRGSTSAPQRNRFADLFR